MAPRERAYWAAGILDDATRTRVEPKVRLAAFESIKTTESAGDKVINSDWNYGTRDVPRNVVRCLEKAGDCAGAWRAYPEAERRFNPRPRTDPAKIREGFESELVTGACKAK